MNPGVNSSGAIESRQPGCETQWVCSTVDILHQQTSIFPIVCHSVPIMAIVSHSAIAVIGCYTVLYSAMSPTQISA